MDIHDFSFIKGMKFRSYLFKVSCVVLAILNSYKIIADDKINLFYLLAMVVTAISSSELDRAVYHVDNVKNTLEGKRDDRNN